MKTIMSIAVGCLTLLMVGVTTTNSQESYTIITGSAGPEVCVGRWIPPRDPGLPGTCDGTVMGFNQFTALSASQSVDRLDQLLVVLDSIDQKMSANLDQFDQLIDATRATQNAIDEQNRQTNQILRDTISRRFDTLPAEVLANDAFREELSRLREDILDEVDRYYQSKPAP